MVCHFLANGISLCPDEVETKTLQSLLQALLLRPPSQSSRALNNKELAPMLESFEA